MHRADGQPNDRRSSGVARRAARRSRRGTRTGIALIVTAAALGVGSPGVAARDSTEVENCSDDQTLCTTLTVERPTTPAQSPEQTGGVLNYCGPFYLQDDGSYTVDVCDSRGDYVQTVTAHPSRSRPQPRQSTVVSSALGALNPPRPTIQTSPSHTRGLLVQTPTWLWLTPSYWRTYSTTIMVWGYVVTIFATPTVVRWNMGNGDTITCIGPGTPWLPGFDDALSTCNYTYRHSSDGAASDRYRITATVTFVGSFTSVGLGGMRGPLGAVTRSSSVYAPVAEIQGLVV